MQKLRCIFFVQCYKLNKFAESSDKIYEDWYPVESEIHADRLNREYTGPELERMFKKLEDKNE